MKIRIIALLSLVAVAVSSCYSVGLQDLTSDPDYDGNKTSTFRIFKVLQFDDVNVSGIDILPYFDFFNTFRLTLNLQGWQDFQHVDGQWGCSVLEKVWF